jgi:hypothetical protein
MASWQQEGGAVNEGMRIELLGYIQQSHEVAKELDVDIEDARHALRMYEIRHSPLIQKVEAFIDALSAGFMNFSGIYRKKGEGNPK